jgi:hypothetical protein
MARLSAGETQLEPTVDPEEQVLSNGAVNQTAVSGEGETTLTASAVDNAGNQSAGSLHPDR